MTRNIVFVCLHGSAKSVIAGEYFERLATARGVRATATALGVEPDAAIPPRVIDGLMADGIDVRGRQPRGVAPEDLKGASRIVSFGCDLGALAPAGVPIDRWDGVPAVSDDFGQARDAIVARVTALLEAARE